MATKALTCSASPLVANRVSNPLSSAKIGQCSASFPLPKKNFPRLGVIRAQQPQAQTQEKQEGSQQVDVQLQKSSQNQGTAMERRPRRLLDISPFGMFNSLLFVLLSLSLTMFVVTIIVVCLYMIQWCRKVDVKLDPYLKRENQILTRVKSGFTLFK